jgi:hypothetical protein
MSGSPYPARQTATYVVPHARGAKQIAEKTMRLGYFTMPVHPMERKWHETLKEDREADILADRHDYHDDFNAEQHTDL